MPLTDTAARQAKAEGLLEVNPAADLVIVAVPEPPEQHNPNLRRHELKELLVALRDFKCAEYARSAVKLLLLTGVRTIELRSATFDQFDFVEGLWTIPPGIVKQLQRRVRTKSGRFHRTWYRFRGRRWKRRSTLTRSPGAIAGRNEPRKPISDGSVNNLLKRMGYAPESTSRSRNG